MRPIRTLFTASIAFAAFLPVAACAPQEEEFTDTPATEEVTDQPGMYGEDPGLYEQDTTQLQQQPMQPQQTQPQQLQPEQQSF